MEEQRFYLPDLDNHLISGQSLEKLLRRADATAALLYLYILRQRGRLDRAEAMNAINLSEQELRHAVGVLASLNLISGTGAQEKKQEMPEREELPQYTAAEMEQKMQADASFRALVKEVGGMLGKILTAPDLNILMGIYRELGLPPEVIYQLVSHLTKEHRARYGEGKSPSLRGVEKIAYIWAREGILNLDAAMAYIKRREERQSQIGRLKQILDIKQDKLTPTQEKYIFGWLDMGFDIEVLGLAYDKTITATGKLQWQYMNAILTKWHEKNLHSQEAIEGAESIRKNGGAKSEKPQQIVPTRDEIARKRELLEQMRQGSQT